MSFTLTGITMDNKILLAVIVNCCDIICLLVNLLLYCTPRNHQGTIPAGKSRRNVKFVAFWCVFLTKIKVYPESWCYRLSIKQPSKKKIPKDNFT